MNIGRVKKRPDGLIAVEVNDHPGSTWGLWPPDAVRRALESEAPVASTLGPPVSWVEEWHHRADKLPTAEVEAMLRRVETGVELSAVAEDYESMQTIVTASGYRIEVFIDGGTPDYIDHVIGPCGRRWDWYDDAEDDGEGGLRCGPVSARGGVFEEGD